MINDILVLVDFSSSSMYATSVASNLCKKSNANIHLMYVKTNEYITYSDIEEEFIKLKSKDFLNNINIKSIIKENDICEEVKKYETNNNIDLIIMGSMKESDNYDSLSSKLKNSASSPVLAVRSEFYREKNLFLKENNEKIENTNIKIISKQKEIIDSISYARRIQRAILPSDHVMDKYLKNYFVLYKPKDIVAGDFYWMEHIDDLVLFASADCTGHGVPGAMVSVICNNALNHSVREHELTDPGLILDRARKIVVSGFEESDEIVRDGMDIAICSIEGSVLKYAGALNPLWIIRPIINIDEHDKYNTITLKNGEFALIEIKADKQPIGEFDNKHDYTTHTLNMKSGDTIYIFSDGFVDQFGGERGKKFKAKSLRNLLIGIQKEDMSVQKDILNSTFDNWKGKLEQIDDVCFIGVRF